MRADRAWAEQAWAWGLFAVFALHNVEEAATMPAFLDGGGELPRALGLGASLLVPWLVAVTVVTVAALVVVLAATARPPRSWAPGGLRILAWVMVVNVLVPHVPAAIVTEGYVPGLVTSVLLALPAGAAFLLRGRGPGILSR